MATLALRALAKVDILRERAVAEGDGVFSNDVSNTSDAAGRAGRDILLGGVVVMAGV